MSYSSGLIQAPVKSDTASGDIQLALGVSTGDLGTLCTHANINKFAKYKPTSIQGYTSPTAAQLAAAGYGLRAVATNSKTALRTMSLGWTYDGAAAPYFRQLDFDGYYNGAPIPFMQANGQTLLVDLISGNTTPAVFYMMMNAGYLRNKNFVAGGGIGNSNAVPSGYDAYCICVEDLGFDSGGGSMHSMMGGVVGLVIFNGTSVAAEIWSSKAVDDYNQRYNEMYSVPTSGLSLGAGTYTAVACCKVSDGLTYYLPVYDDANYPARFTLEVGGLSSYKQARTGLSTSQSGTYSTMLNSNADDIFVKMKFYNQTGRSVTLNNVTNGRFILSTRVQGSRVDMQTGNTISIDRTQTSSLVLPTSDPTIADGSYVEMVFKILNIWSNTAGSQVPAFTSGSLDISPSIQFYSGGTATDFGQYGNPQVLTVRYS